MTDIGSKERRMHKRISFVRQIEVEDIGTRRCSDLSVEGMYLQSVVSFPPNATLNLKFKLDEEDAEPIRATARVLYQHNTVGFGLNFVSLSPTDRDKLQEYVLGGESNEE